MDIRPVAGNTSPPPMAEKPAPVRRDAVEAALSAVAVEAANESAASRAISDEKLDQAISSINNVFSARAQELAFTVDKESDRTIVTVIDKNTKEVIRQMPSREALEIAKALDRLQSLLTKQTA